jgi:hypothetical protein
MPAKKRPTRRTVRPYEGISITPRGIRIFGGFRLGRIGDSKRVVKF